MSGEEEIFTAGAILDNPSEVIHLVSVVVVLPRWGRTGLAVTSGIPGMDPKTGAREVIRSVDDEVPGRTQSVTENEVPPRSFAPAPKDRVPRNLELLFPDPWRVSLGPLVLLFPHPSRLDDAGFAAPGGPSHPTPALGMIQR